MTMHGGLQYCRGSAGSAAGCVLAELASRLYHRPLETVTGMLCWHPRWQTIWRSGSTVR